MGLSTCLIYFLFLFFPFLFFLGVLKGNQKDTKHVSGFLTLRHTHTVFFFSGGGQPLRLVF